MTARFLVGWAMAAVVAAITGCENRSVVIKPNGTVAVSLDAAKKRESITVGLANLVALTMPPSAPDYGWEISFHDTRYLKQYTEFTPPKAAGEGATISFVAVATGLTRLRFVLVPVARERSVRPVDQQEITVTIR